MVSGIDRRPAADDDLVEIRVHIARQNGQAADRTLDRIERALRNLAETPLIGRARPELAEGLRWFVVGRGVAFCIPTERGIDVARVLGGAMEVRPDGVG